MQIHRRQALKLLAAAGATGLASGCGAARAGDPAPQLYDTPALIGLLVPGTGGYKSIGDDIINGFRQYLRTTGERLGGHLVTLTVVDEGDTPETARASLERLLADSPHALVGVANSAALMEIKGLVEESHIPLLGTHASPRDLQGVTYIWRTSYIDDEAGLALGGHLATRITGRVALVAQDDPAGVDAVSGFREAFAAEGRSDRLADPVFTRVETQPDRGFFAAALQEVVAVGAEAVFACYAGAAAVEFVRQYREAGLDVRRLYAPGYLTEGAALDVLGADAAGITTASNYAPELRTATNRTFTADYRTQFGGIPSSYAVAAYDAAAALDKAIRLAANNLTARQVNLMLSHIGLIDSPRGLWQFNQNRTPTQKWYLRQVAKDGPVLSNIVLKELGTFG